MGRPDGSRSTVSPGVYPHEHTVSRFSPTLEDDPDTGGGDPVLSTLSKGETEVPGGVQVCLVWVESRKEKCIRVSNLPTIDFLD